MDKSSLKMPKWDNLASFWKTEACDQIVLPDTDRSFSIGQNWWKRPKIKKATFWGILREFRPKNLFKENKSRIWCIGKLCVERMKVILLHWQNLGKSIHLVGWLCESKRRRENWGFVVSRINLWQWMQYSIWMVFNATISAKWRKLASSILLFCRFSLTLLQWRWN